MQITRKERKLQDKNGLFAMPEAPQTVSAPPAKHAPKARRTMPTERLDLIDTQLATARHDYLQAVWDLNPDAVQAAMQRCDVLLEARWTCTHCGQPYST